MGIFICGKAVFILKQEQFVAGYQPYPFVKSDCGSCVRLLIAIA